MTTGKAPIGFTKKRELGLVVIIVVLCVFITIKNPSFLSYENIIDLLRNTSILLILASGMMRILITGGIDLSVSAILAFSGMIASMALAKDNTIHPIILILYSVLIGAVCGAVNGLLIAKLHISPIIATLSLSYILRGSTFLISGGSWVSANQMSDGFKNIATGSFLGINYLIWIAAAILLLSNYFMEHRTLGRRIYAVGSNLQSAQVSGINIVRVIVITYVLMGALDGLAGVLWASKFASAQSDSAKGYELSVIATCVLGGVSITGGSGKVLGVLLGGLIMGILGNGLPIINVSSFWQNAIQGFVILFAVLTNMAIKRRENKISIERRVI
jgi:rhamnose transport system permease protein